MLILNMSGTWNNKHKSIFAASDAYYNDGEVRPNSNTPGLMESNGNCMITGDADVLGYCNIFGDVL